MTYRRTCERCTAPATARATNLDNGNTADRCAQHADGWSTCWEITAQHVDRGCRQCRNATETTPPHLAAADCQAGSRRHCTCRHCY